jgi:hypothetical protein
MDLQGCSKKGPRGFFCKSFNDCVMFHLLNVFPNKMDEQERYYITNVLKKPQCISMHQFVMHVEQLNSYIAQLPCWFYSPSAKPSSIPMNVLLAKAVLASHILWMCPLMWQDQFNLHKKGMAPVNIPLFLMSLEAIEHACAREKSNTKLNKKASNKVKNGNNSPGTESIAIVLKKTCTKSIATSAISMGACIPCTTQRIVVGTRKSERKRQNFYAAKKGRIKPDPAKQSFAQLSKKLDKLEKAIKKQSTKGKKCCRSDSDSDLEYGIGLGSIAVPMEITFMDM